METNRNKLVSLASSGSIAHPSLGKSYWTSFDGQAINVPSVGSIVYDFKIGDNCIDLVGDHVEPGVSIKNNDSSLNMSLNHLACIGNIATITSGNAKGKTGVVTGKHGGVDHIIIHFEDEILDQLVIGDHIQIRTVGLGLAFTHFPQIKLFNMDPNLLERLKINVDHNQKVKVKVTKVLPAHLLGAGLGSANIQIGDYDIMMHDESENIKYELNDLRFGDFVAIEDHYAAFGPHYKKGALSIGIIVHSNSQSAGHGPGVVIIMSDQSHTLEYQLDQTINLINYI
ncbi:MAG: DUF4438 domain-containing protein [Erysipelothrix sp.]|nr:DUF4438 domain-containing protein [Erysipelothrix sp.]